MTISKHRVAINIGGCENYVRLNSDPSPNTVIQEYRHYIRSLVKNTLKTGILIS
jgi:hypothetical protein